MAVNRDMSRAEFEIMDVLWRRERATVREVHEELQAKRKLSYSTVATLLGRLKDKGYVEAKEKNFAYQFRPKVKREQVISRKLSELVDRILGGDVAPLTAYIAQNRNLTPEQLQTLEEIAKSDSGGENS